MGYRFLKHKNFRLKGNSHLDPFQINFLPEFMEGRGPVEPFMNEFGVVIGDHDYESPHSPLEQWSKDTDPEVMAGSQWVHPFKDIGFHAQENKDYFEKGIAPQSGIFMHPDKNTSAASLGVVDENEQDQPSSHS